MRVLYVVSAYARHTGDVITPWLTETIRQLQTQGVEVEVLAPAYRGSRTQRIEGVRVHRFRYGPKRLERLSHDQAIPERLRASPLWWALVPGYLAGGMLATARLARRFDVVHVLWPMPHGLFALPISTPFVCTFLGSDLAFSQRWAPFYRLVTRKAAVVTAISSHTAARLATFVPERAPLLTPFAAALALPSEPCSYPSAERKRLLFIGRLVERKGAPVLLRALTLSDASLTLIGDGPQRAQLEAQVDALGLRARVTFAGWVSEEAKREALRQCHALVLPAVVDARSDTEGQGVVLLEAMAMARPVIASRIGGIVDMVEDGVHGWLVPSGDHAALACAIERVFADPARAAAQGVAGFARVRDELGAAHLAGRFAAAYRMAARC